MARAKRTCARCPRIIAPGTGSHCGACTAEIRRDTDQRRGSSTERGYGKAHRAMRDVVLARDPICVLCGVAWSTVADHWPHSRRELFELGRDPDDPTACRGLCKSCHDKRTAADQGGWRSVHSE
jgi:5-methylcytosine-specific restriction protein A